MTLERIPLRILGSALLVILISVVLLRFFPGYLTNTQFLAGIIFLQVLLAIVWNYRQRLMPALALAFLGAGTYTPLQPVFSPIRWVLLAIGALGGLALYLRERGHWFGLFHAIALSCILSSFASAVVSTYAEVSFLKAASLLLLFLYGISGARLVVLFSSWSFLSSLRIGLEVFTYITAVSYFVFHYSLMGNPNSLGAIMGVIVLPYLLWFALTSDDAGARHKRQLALIISICLLLSSYSRASIGAGFIAALLICFGLRQYKFFVRGLAVALLCAVVVAALVPMKSETSGQGQTPVAKFLYKGHESQNVLQSRLSVWDQTIDSIRSHPFFGTGFGTSLANENAGSSRLQGIRVSSDVGVREHGNSYLAIMEWQGLLGVIPFFALISLVALYAVRVFIQVRNIQDLSSPLIVFAAVMLGGLFHAAFEDWLFAVGYYLCVYFWIFAFIFVDLLHRASEPYPEAETTFTPVAQSAAGSAT